MHAASYLRCTIEYDRKREFVSRKHLATKRGLKASAIKQLKLILVSRQTNAILSLTSGNSFLTWSVVVVVPVTIDELLLVVEVPDVLILRLEAALASCSSRALNSSLCDGIVDSGERSAEQVEEVVLEVHAAEDAGQILVEAVVGDG